MRIAELGLSIITLFWESIHAKLSCSMQLAYYNKLQRSLSSIHNYILLA